MWVAPELLPEVEPSGWGDAELARQIGAFDALEARAHAQRLLAVARWARSRRRSGGLVSASGRGGPGVDARALADSLLTGIGEDFVVELAVTRSCSEDEAQVLLREALLLTGPLAPTWRHLFAGSIGVRHAKAAVDLLGDATPEVARQVQARVLPTVGGRTVAVFRERLRYHLYRVDAEAKERRRREALERVGWVRRFDENVSDLVVQGPTPAVHAA